ncbi:ArsR/SmtB family transcription factor [Xanthobacter sp. TB0136]|uniref:ArsR/SmtB family transcription factor n=1 Tax=Xanthobacter sp. TB0136 TaxID=3459177 RepID=UPI00403968B1
MEPGEIQDFEKNVGRAAAFLGGLASPHRLRILCQLAEGEKSVSQLIEATGLPQTSMSQHLGKLKDEGIVTFRREHRTLYYSISNPAALAMLNILHAHYCG